MSNIHITLPQSPQRPILKPSSFTEVSPVKLDISSQISSQMLDSTNQTTFLQASEQQSSLLALKEPPVNRPNRATTLTSNSFGYAYHGTRKRSSTTQQNTNKLNKSTVEPSSIAEDSSSSSQFDISFQVSGRRGSILKDPHFNPASMNTSQISSKTRPSFIGNFLREPKENKVRRVGIMRDIGDKNDVKDTSPSSVILDYTLQLPNRTRSSTLGYFSQAVKDNQRRRMSTIKDLNVSLEKNDSLIIPNLDTSPVSQDTIHENPIKKGAESPGRRLSTVKDVRVSKEKSPASSTFSNLHISRTRAATVGVSPVRLNESKGRRLSIIKDSSISKDKSPISAVLNNSYMAARPRGATVGDRNLSIGVIDNPGRRMSTTGHLRRPVDRRLRPQGSFYETNSDAKDSKRTDVKRSSRASSALRQVLGESANSDKKEALIKFLEGSVKRAFKMTESKKKARDDDGEKIKLSEKFNFGKQKFIEKGTRSFMNESIDEVKELESYTKEDSRKDLVEFVFYRGKGLNMYSLILCTLNFVSLLV